MSDLYNNRSHSLKTKSTHHSLLEPTLSISNYMRLYNLGNLPRDFGTGGFPFRDLRDCH